jgi:hypothetical protein
VKIAEVIVISVAMTALSVVARANDYTAVEAAKHIGEQATVTDKLDDVHQAQGGSIFLNMGGRHPNEAFTGFIPAKNASQFPDYSSYRGSVVSISGKIEDHEGKPQIIVKAPSQIVKKGGGDSPSRTGTKPTPTATPPPVQTPAATASPGVASQTPTPTPKPTSSETITLTQPLRIRLKYGETTLQPGTVLRVVGGDANGVVVEYAGERVTLPAH